MGATAFIVTWRHTPWFIERLTAAGLTAKDMYKLGTPSIATKGGIILVIAATLALLALPYFGIIQSLIGQAWTGREINSAAMGPSVLDSSILVVILFYALFGLSDDFLRFTHPLKLVIPAIFALPLTRVLAPTNWVTPFGTLPLGESTEILGLESLKWVYVAALVVLPVYIMVVTNLVNMHSGFNGLQTGASLILLGGFSLKMAIDGREMHMVAPAFAGACAGFLIFNRCPARIFEGNTGSLAVGAAIGAVIVASGYYTAGVVALIPHEVNFMQYVYWRTRRKLNPADDRFKEKKFGRVRPDATIEVPNRLTLKWVLPAWRPMTEKTATRTMVGLSAAFMALALLIPY